MLNKHPHTPLPPSLAPFIDRSPREKILDPASLGLDASTRVQWTFHQGEGLEKWNEDKEKSWRKCEERRKRDGCAGEVEGEGQGKKRKGREWNVPTPSIHEM
eukprot:scaffold2636_cov340-Pavlova_lutheri.AAC.93